MLDPTHPICREGAGGLLISTSKSCALPFSGNKGYIWCQDLGAEQCVNSAGGCVESLFELSQPRELFSSVPSVVLCSFSDVWQLPCLGWKAHKTKVEKTVSFLCLCQALPWTRRVCCSPRGQPRKRENRGK